jgi:hypothetical protein
MNKRLSAIFFIIFFIFVSCSDDFSRTEEPLAQTSSIAGILTDPPVEGAQVFAVSNVTLEPFPFNESSSKTDENGKFFLTIKSGSLNQVSHIESKGGADSKTGLAFDDIRFKALFSPEKNSVQIVSPLTSIIYHLVQDHGFTQEQAKDKTRQLFNISPDISPEDNPVNNKELLKASILTSYLAVLKKTKDPFKEIADVLKTKSKFIENSGIDENTLNQIFNDSETTQISKNLFSSLSQNYSLDEIIKNSKIFFLKQAFLEIVDSMIKNDDKDYDTHLENIKTNLEFISQILVNNKISLRHHNLTQTLRYILNEYGLSEIKFESNEYKFEGVFFTGTVKKSDLYNSDNIFISNDKNIERTNSPLFYFRHNEPVLINEIPGNDNLKRINYYFHSDINHLYLATKTLDLVYDDLKRDEILRQIANGYAHSGLFERALLIADAYIFTPAEKCLTYFSIGEYMSDYGKKEMSLTTIKKGQTIFWDIVLKKGYHLFNRDDAQRFYYMIKAFARAGNTILVKQNLTRLKENVIPGIQNDFLTYSQILVAIKISIKNFFELGNADKDDLTILNDFLFELSKDCPPNEISNGKKYYKMKIYAMADAAFYYGRLNMPGSLNEVYESIQQIRQNDGLRSNISINDTYYLNLTGEETWNYMAQVIEAYAWLEGPVIYSAPEAIFDSFPSNNKYYNDAVSAYANIKAKKNEVESAIEMVVSMISDDNQEDAFSERIEALTFKNKYNPRIGMSAIESNNPAGARQAAILALSYSDRIYNSASDYYKYSKKIQRGYLKTAVVFNLAGSDSYENLSFENAQKVINGGTISGDGYSYTPGPITGISYYLRAALESAVCAHELQNNYYKNIFIDLAVEKSIEAFNSGSVDYEDKTDFLIDTAQTSAEIRRYDIISDIFDITLDSASKISFYDTDEDEIIDEAEALIEFGEVLSYSGLTVKAKNIFNLALTEINKIQTQKDKTKLQKDAATALASANLTQKALDISAQIKFAEEKFEVLSEIAKFYALKDDFPDIKGAAIDFDHDGKPYFFSPFLTPQEFADSGLILDDDSDNDGIKDIYDPMPLYKN